MSYALKRLFSMFLVLNIFQASLLYSQDKNIYSDTCKQLLEWIYKELTLKNFEQSIQRANKKLLASMLITLQNNKSIKLKNHPELLTLWKSMKELDPKFEKYLKKNKPYKKFSKNGFFTQLFGGLTLDDVNTVSYFDAIESWSKLQISNPEYFKGLPQELKLDKWDLVTAKLVEDAGKIRYENDDKENVLKDITSISNRLKRLSIDHSELIALDGMGINDIKKSLDSIQNKIVEKMKVITDENKEEFSEVCKEEDYNDIVNGNPENYVCPIEVSPTNNLTLIQDNLVQLAHIIPDIDDLNLVYRPEVPVLSSDVDDLVQEKSAVDKLCPIEIDYMKVEKPSKSATYNMRSNAIVDTVVIHHTGDGTNLKTNAESIHRGHIDRTTDNDAWYMVGYNYLVSLGGNGSSIKNPAIIKGRDSNFRGAHAGGYTLPLSIDEIEKLMDTFQFYNCKEVLDANSSTFPVSQIQKKNICDEGVENRRSSNDYNCGALASNIAAVQNNGSISGNMNSIGVAVMGNFSKHSGKNFMGEKLYNSKTLNVSQVKSTLVPKLVELINALKIDYPGIKKIVPHSYFKSTECPGTIRNVLSEVAQITGLKVYITKAEDIRSNDYRYSETVTYKKYLKHISKIATIEKELISLNTAINDLETKWYSNTNQTDYQLAQFKEKVRVYQKEISNLQTEKVEITAQKDELLRESKGHK
jgi:hypothetical protein